MGFPQAKKCYTTYALFALESHSLLKSARVILKLFLVQELYLPYLELDHDALLMEVDKERLKELVRVVDPLGVLANNPDH